MAGSGTDRVLDKADKRSLRRLRLRLEKMNAQVAEYEERRKTPGLPDLRVEQVRLERNELRAVLRRLSGQD